MKKNLRLTTNDSQQGITLYLAMLIMSAALATALFISAVFVKEFKISKEVVNSLKAVYVADSTMEYTLYQTRIVAASPTDLGFPPFTVVIPNQHYQIILSDCSLNLFSVSTTAVCKVDAFPATALGSTPGCPSTSPASNCTRVISKGAYGNTNRALEIVYENL